MTSIVPATNLIGMRVAIVSMGGRSGTPHRYGILRGIMPIDQYRINYLIQLDDSDHVVRNSKGEALRLLYRIVEISNTDECYYVALDPDHPSTKGTAT